MQDSTLTSDSLHRTDIKLSAQYSIASAGPGEEVELAIDRLPDGEVVSPFLVDDLELGDTVELRGPLGGWFVWRPEQTQPIQLIAGGSGVVPFVAMNRKRQRRQRRADAAALFAPHT